MAGRILGFAAVTGLLGLGLALGTSLAHAETAVKVSLTGESGGKMGMDLSTSSAPAGKVRFEVVDAAASTGHEMIVVRLASKDEKLPLNASKHRIDEAAVKSLGEVSGLKAGQKGTLTVDLKPGDYELVCNHKGHYEAGMFAPFTVTP